MDTSILRKLVKRVSDGYILPLGNYTVTACHEFGWNDWVIRDSHGYITILPVISNTKPEDVMAEVCNDFLKFCQDFSEQEYRKIFKRTNY